MRTLAAAGGQVAGVHPVAGEVPHGVVAALAGGPRVTGHRLALDRGQGRAQGGTSLGVEGAVEHERAVHGLAQPDCPPLVGRVGLFEGAVGVQAVAEVLGDVAEGPWVQLTGGLHQHGLLLLDRLQADLVGRPGHEGDVGGADVAGGEGGPGLGQLG